MRKVCVQVRCDRAEEFLFLIFNHPKIVETERDARSQCVKFIKLRILLSAVNQKWIAERVAAEVC